MDSTITRQLRWICRVCAVNIKEKGSDLASVHVFGPAQINEKLRKYFGIEVHRHDNLPKNICSTCYRKLEAMHEFAALAWKADRFFKIFTTKPQTIAAAITQEDFNTIFQKEFASFIQNYRSKSQKLKEKQKQYRSLLKQNSSKPSRTESKPRVQTNPAQQQPQKSDKLEEKRQNLKAVLATSNAVAMQQQQPRIKVKSESDLRSPRLNSVQDTSSTPMTTTTSLPTPIQTMIAAQNSNPHVLYGNHLCLGQVIRDIDLLTLILKALKWPYTSDDILIQIERLKTVPFHDVIRNQNLLQDTDLMQILNTILSPMILQRSLVPNVSVTSVPPLAPQQQQQATQLFPALVSYKIPADLSVHLITEEVDDEPRLSNCKPPPPVLVKQQQNPVKRQKVRQRRPKTKISKIRPHSPIEIASDDSIQMFEVNVDPGLYLTPEDNSNSNDSQRRVERLLEQNKIRKKQKRKEAHIEINREEELIVPDVISVSVNQSIQLAEIKTDEEKPTTAPISQENPANKSTDGVISGDENDWVDFKVSSSPDVSMEKKQSNESWPINSLAAPPQKADVQVEIITSDLQTEEITSTSQSSTPAEKIQEPVREEITKEEIEVKMEVTEETNLRENLNSSPKEKDEDDEKTSPKRRGNPKKTAVPLKEDESCEEKSNAQNKRKITTSSPIPAKKPERKTATVQNAKTARSTRSNPAPAQTLMSLRNSNTRRRICKQCGQSFTLLTEFLDHRKMHIQG